MTIVDSGASEHFSGIGDDFTSLKRWKFPKIVQIADGKVIQCEGYGTNSFQIGGKNLGLIEVWFVPEFGQMRLLSVWVFNKRGIDVNFTGCYFRISRGQLLFDAQGEGGVIKVKMKPIPQAMPVLEREDEPLNISESEWDILHRRLGHLKFKGVDKILRNDRTGVNVPTRKRPTPLGATSCESYLAGKMKEYFNKKSDRRADTILRRIYCDISGIQSMSVRGYRYYLPVVDGVSRDCWIRLLKTKEM
ncbi:hypothetical protein K3495_g12278 [Podosphaera aphanis]|nr:hypothetical protein K3495_g12278 [Podosphaera aphanis]